MGVIAGLRRRMVTVLALVGLSAVALVVGIWQFASLPAATGPRPAWWAFPAVAVAATSGLAVLRRDRPVWPNTVAAAGRRQPADVGMAASCGLTKAALATDAPGWLDRARRRGAIGGRRRSHRTGPLRTGAGDRRTAACGGDLSGGYFSNDLMNSTMAAISSSDSEFCGIACHSPSPTSPMDRGIDSVR